MNLWLDDVRCPPYGWTLAKNFDEACALLVTGEVEHASLDHDLGVCDDCYVLGDQATDERVCAI